MSLILGILLAAGASQRFGADKLMHCMPNGEPVAVHACRHLLAGTDGVLAVVRSGSELLPNHLQTLGAQVKIHANASLGMGTSLAFGIRACPEADGWVVALADMPWISTTTINRIADELRSGAIIAAPVWEGRRGHPVGFSAAMRNELRVLSGDAGAKMLIQRHLAQLSLIECNDPGILWDIDQPDDLQNRQFPLL